MWQSESLAVLHLGNPKSLAGLYRRIRWHGQGVWENGQGIQWSVTTTATLLHPVAVLFGVLYGGWLISLGYPIGALVALGGLIAIPFLFVAARGLQHRRRVPVVGGIALMFITFMARLDGLFAARRAAAREHAV